MYNVKDIAFEVIKIYNSSIDKMPIDKYYITEEKLTLLLVLIQGAYYQKYQKEAFLTPIYLSSNGSFDIYIQELKELFQPIFFVNDKNRIEFTKPFETYIPQKLDKDLKDVVDTILDYYMGYEEWYIKDKIRHWESIETAIKDGSFNVKVKILGKDFRQPFTTWDYIM